MKRIELFSTPIWVATIPPSSYNKKEVIDTITKNYEMQPNRNNHDSFYSNMHNYYSDWNNKNFISTDLTKLNEIYKQLIAEFVSSQKYTRPIQYRYDIVNVTASKNGQRIDSHDHAYCDFVAVHYISLKKESNHRSTTFENPTIYGYYTDMNSKLKSFMDITYIENSVYAGTYTLNSNEDEFVIFPSYLKHLVLNESTSDTLRIATSCNITLEEAK